MQKPVARDRGRVRRSVTSAGLPLPLEFMPAARRIEPFARDHPPLGGPPRGGGR